MSRETGPATLNVPHDVEAGLPHWTEEDVVVLVPATICRPPAVSELLLPIVKLLRVPISICCVTAVPMSISSIAPTDTCPVCAARADVSP
jgi:hypothetical protein